MIRRNIDASKGLVNGTIGKVTSVVKDVWNSNVEKINLLLPSGEEFLIERVCVKFPIMERIYVVRKQFPLCLSYGITIHKSQGLSLQNAIMDIGNSVFSPGQIYVALSRVTSLEGLYLINYDPSSVKASEETIIEYNRLKKIHKPEAQNIRVSKQKIRKVKDNNPWTSSKVIASVQEPQEPYQNVQKSTGWIIRGFQNTDKVSSYANATLQCLLHLSIIRKQIFNYDKEKILLVLMHQYENGMPNLNTNRIRQYLGDNFSNSVNRDASEFLLALCAKFDFMKCIVEHEVTSTTRCRNCEYTNTVISNNVLISVPIINLEKKSYDLNDLLSVTFPHWCESINDLCNTCNKNDKILKREVTLTKEILIIHFVLFSEDGKVIPANKLNIRAVPTTKVSISGQLYKVMNAIFTNGLCIENNHYISLCREGKSSWLGIDDMQIRKQHWPKNATNAYILFLEKINK